MLDKEEGLIHYTEHVTEATASQPEPHLVKFASIVDFEILPVFSEGPWCRLDASARSRGLRGFQGTNVL